MNLYWEEGPGIPVADRGLAYGDGLFETIRMQGTCGVLTSRHIARMVAGARALGIPLPEDDLRAIVREASLRFGEDPSDAGWVLKLVLTRGAGGRGYRPTAELVPTLVVSAASMPAVPDGAGVSADLSGWALMVNPRLAGIKTLNRLEQVMASREISGDTYEMIMANPSGQLVEGTRTNLLVKTAGGWLCPGVRHLAVAGVMRDHVVGVLERQGERVAVDPIPPVILEADECRGLFLMNSVIGVVPVRRWQGRDLPVDTSLATIFNPLDLVEPQV